MSIIVTIGIFSIAFLLGMLTYKELNNFVINKERKEKKNEIDSIFKLVLDSIKGGQSAFKSRFLQTAYVTTNTTKTGIIDVIYLLDKNDVAIIKNDKVKYTSEGVDREIIDKIINSINLIHGHEIINDVVNVFGLLFSKKDFESNFKMKFEDFNKIINRTMGNESDSEIDVINDNQNSFDIDEILDKIGKHGMGSLTAEEKKYLNDFSNGRKD